MASLFKCVCDRNPSYRVNINVKCFSCNILLTFVCTYNTYIILCKEKLALTHLFIHTMKQVLILLNLLYHTKNQMLCSYVSIVCMLHYYKALQCLKYRAVPILASVSVSGQCQHILIISQVVMHRYEILPIIRYYISLGR